jgi:radical SAM superfamily enzyme YgiQ (UPF0313 family)
MSGSREIFQVVLIKPTHYDDDGYPIQWLRSLIPSNTLASLNGLVLDCNERQVLGPDIEIRSLPADETNTRIRADKIIQDIERAGTRSLICFVGVQSNQFPRAVDLAKPFLAARLPVAIGGFHVSGCLSMLPEPPREIVEAQDMGISIFAGEADEGRLDAVLQDAYNGTLKPIYNHMKNLPSIEAQPVPFLPGTTINRTIDRRSSFDMGRGCPFQCSFCTIINVQGRKSRFRSPDDLERIIRENHAQGIHKFFITDDNFSRNRDWEAMLDRLIWLKKDQGLKCKFIIQVDTLCHKIPNFIEKAKRAGVNRVFIGLENINPETLRATKKRQNTIGEYRRMLLKWREHGVSTCGGYILGFPNDTRESILRDIETIKRELPIDMLEFFYLTPLPGSEDHQRQLKEGVWMDPDLNKYDLYHRVTHHPRMSDEEWEQVYREAWLSYYSPEHIERIARRAGPTPRRRMEKRVSYIFEFFQVYTVEGLHPLEGGILRLKFRRDRRPGMPLQNPLIFYPAFALETVFKITKYAAAFLRQKSLYRRVQHDPKKMDYTDEAIAPLAEDAPA